MLFVNIFFFPIFITVKADFEAYIYRIKEKNTKREYKNRRNRGFTND